MLKKLIEFLIHKLVDNPKVISISEIQANGKSIIEIKVSAQDLAKIIGKEGRTFKALRSLVNVIDPETKRDIVLDVVT